MFEILINFWGHFTQNWKKPLKSLPCNWKKRSIPEFCYLIFTVFFRSSSKYIAFLLDVNVWITCKNQNELTLLHTCLALVTLEIAFFFNFSLKFSIFMMDLETKIHSMQHWCGFQMKLVLTFAILKNPYSGNTLLNALFIWWLIS